MGKLIHIELTKIRRYPVTWIVVLITLGQAVFWVFTDKYDANLVYYPQLEYILFTYCTARWFCISFLFLTAYVIAGDFSMRTVLNVLSSGIDKRKYYFSRLAAIMLFLWGVFIGSNLFYIFLRILTTGKVNTVLPFKELFILLLVLSMQILAYAAMANIISVCCQKQALSVFLAEAFMFLVLILRLFAIGEDFYTGAASRLHGPIAYEPLYVMETIDYHLTLSDTLWSFGFLKYLLSAALIIAVTSIIGYVRLMRSEVQ